MGDNDDKQLGLFEPPSERHTLPPAHLNGTDTINAVRARMSKRMRDGDSMQCPCCDRRVTLYSRSIHAAMAWGLMIVVREWVLTQDWVHVITAVDRMRTAGKAKDLLGRSVNPMSDFAKLRYWDLIKPGDAKGMWKPTTAGVQFAAGRIRVPKTAFVYNGKCYGFDAEKTDIHIALAERFDFDAMMSSMPPLGHLLDPLP